MKDEQIFKTLQKIIEVINHPEYVYKLKLNDISLLKLEYAVEFSDSIRPICLETSENLVVSSAIGTGWGQNESELS